MQGLEFSRALDDIVAALKVQELLNLISPLFNSRWQYAGAFEERVCQTTP
jgi:hypothetical protein